jgi:LuxR family transcriptional regulator, maltose regulon positive regulatory protein
MQTTWIASSRVTPPRQRVTLLRRQRLLDRLGAPEPPRLTILEAPAGFGKTTLLAELHGALLERGHSVAWVTVESSECDLHWLCAYLLVSLRRSNVPLSGVNTASDDELLSWSTAALADVLAATIEAHPAPVVLLLDDVHWMAADVLAGEFATLLERLPDNVRVVLASRVRIDQAFWRLAARGELDVIDDRELRFNDDEMRALLGASANSALLERVMVVTEGWPVALQLARIWSNDPRSGRRNLEQLASSSENLSHLVCEQILSSIEEDKRKLLVRCAAFERIGADLFDYVFGRSDGRAFLDWLATHTPMAVRLEDETGWYRHHALFAEFLRAQLQQLPVEQIAQIHERAAEWFLARGLLQDAFRHAEHTGCSEFMAEIAERAGGWRIVMGGGRRALAWMCRLPVADGRTHPLVRLAQIYSMVQDGLIREGRTAYEELRAATRGFTRGRHGRWDPALAIECEMMDVIFRIYEDRPILPQSIFAFERQAATPSALDRRVASLSSNIACYGHYDVGDFESCLRFGGYGLERNRAIGSTYPEVYLLIYMGQACFCLNRTAEARGHYELAVELAQRFYGPANNVHAIASVLLARLEIELGNLEGAAASLEGALETVLEHDGWFDIFAAGLETAFWLRLITQGQSSALDALAPIARQAQSRGLSRLGLLGDLQRAELSLMTGDAASAAQYLEHSARHEVLADPTNPAPRDTRIVALFTELQARRLLLSGQAPAAVQAALDLEAGLERSSLVHAYVRSQLFAVAMSLAAQRPLPRSRIELALRTATRSGVVLSAARLGLPLCEALASIASNDAESAFAARAAQLARQLQSRGTQPPAAVRESLLSPREQEILRELVNGCSNKEIARKLAIAESTVKTHKERLYEKLGVSSRSSAIQAAKSAGLLSS